ncbi:response regulator transcription factor [Streptomyces sp. CB01201]|uniref:response regulator transcription factor n=1 Tax=Streptomyces sp. CB01201 TaxID=2020324 RepID=UPI001F438A07|nr:helix-turn-helix transcriptional regulator [Streptomyces sp. CB01201]
MRDLPMRDMATAASAESCQCEMLRFPHGEEGVLNRLSAREKEVLYLLGTAASNVGIARRLGIAERTVKKHVANILAKLGVSSRLQAALVAIVQHELICPHVVSARTLPLRTPPQESLSAQGIAAQAVGSRLR